MIEIDDELRRKRVLSRLGGIEDSIYLSIDDMRVHAVPRSVAELGSV